MGGANNYRPWTFREVLGSVLGLYEFYQLAHPFVKEYGVVICPRLRT